MRIMVFFIVLSLAGPVFCAEKERPFADKAKLYNHFKEPSLLKDLYFRAKDLSVWISKECAKDEKSCQAVMGVLSQPFSQWNDLDAKSGFRALTDCSKGLFLTHPNPALQKVVGIPFINKIRDINGKLWFLSLCDGLQSNPDGFWDSQYTSWCLSITGINEVWLVHLLIQVPGTDYQVISFIPYHSKSPMRISARVSELNELLKTWAKEWAKKR